MLATPELILEAAQFSRLGELLPRWRQVPLYRETLSRADFSGLPFITKHEIREGFPQNFLGPEQNLGALIDSKLVELEHTSGTSDERTPVLFGRGWWNAQEETVLRLNRFVAKVLDETPNARRATLTPPVCNGVVCFSNWHSRSARTLDQTLFVNLSRIPFVMPEAEQERMAAEIADWSPTFLDLDPVHGVWFALFCERHSIRFTSLRFVLCSYEFVSVVHRRILQRVFGVPVFNLYGSTETGHLLMENEVGEMKPSYDTALLEVVEADAADIGTLLVTTFSNDYMPLLRYRIGDFVQHNERSYGTDYIVHGRIRDTLTAADGSRVTTWQVDQCFAGLSGIVHYQLRQSPNDDFRLRYLPEADGPDAVSLREATSRLESLLHAPVVTESVPTLLPEASGKFRLTCNVVE